MPLQVFAQNEGFQMKNFLFIAIILIVRLNNTEFGCGLLKYPSLMINNLPICNAQAQLVRYSAATRLTGLIHSSILSPILTQDGCHDQSRGFAVDAGPF